MVNNQFHSDTKERKTITELGRRSYLRAAGAAGTGVALGGSGLASVASRRGAAAPTVIDDFEDGDIDEYSGNTGEYTVEQSTALEGNYRLKCTGSYGRIASSTSSPRGYEYKCRFVAGSGSGGKPGLLTCVQTRSRPLEDCYWLVLDIPNQELRVYLRENDTSTMLASASVTASESTEYRGALELDTDTLKGVLYDANGSKITETTAATDTTYSGGYVGVYTGGSPGYPTYYDYVTKASLGSSDGGNPIPNNHEVAENFTLHDLSPFSFDQGESGADIINVAEYGGVNEHGGAYNGPFALEIKGENTEMISFPGDGLAVYPSSGDSFGTWVMLRDNAPVANATYGVQNHDNRYYVQLDRQDGRLWLCKYKRTSINILDSDYITYSDDKWYWLEIEWGTDGTHHAYLYDIEENLLGEVSASDSEWSSGGLGYDAYTRDQGSVLFDEYIVGEYSDRKGRWGSDVLPRTYRHDAGSVDYIEDFRYYFHYGGYSQIDNEHRFALGGFFQTYDIQSGVTDPKPTNYIANGTLDGTQFTIDIQGNSANKVELVRQPPYTDITSVPESEWKTWLEDNWNSEPETFEEVRSTVESRAIDLSIIPEEDVPWEAVIALAIGGVGMYASGPAGYIFTASAELLTGYSLIGSLSEESSCGADLGNAEQTYDKVVWDTCGATSLIGYVVVYEVEDFGLGDSETVTMDIEQKVNFSTFPTGYADEIANWKVEIDGEGRFRLTGSSTENI